MLQNDLADMLPLDGIWQFSTSENEPVGAIQVPGCWEAQGYPKTLEGPVCYRRSFTLPENWAGRRLQLEFDAVSYAYTVVCNGIEVGDHRGMWTPFSFDITGIARAGKESVLEVFVNKPGRRYPMRASLAGFLPDLATTFGGLWQPVRLRGFKAGLSFVTINPEIETKTIRVSCEADNFERPIENGSWTVQVEYEGQPVASQQTPYNEDETLETTLNLPEIAFWSPEQPNLYTVRITLRDGDQPRAQVTQQTGFRCLSADGSQLTLNGQPYLVRGILSWGWEPQRIAPFYTPDQARAEMRRVKAMGFNTIKLCLFVPNRDYFAAADEEGVLLWAEYPMWLPEVTPDLRMQAPREYRELTRLLNSHPSVAIYSLGCEMNREVNEDLLKRLNEAVRGLTQDVLVCDNSGSGESYGGLDIDLADFRDYHPYYDIQYFAPLLDHWRRDWQPSRPLIFGEFCDADTFRDLDAIIQSNGGGKPWWMTTDNPVTSWRAEGRALVEQPERLEAAQPGFDAEELVKVSHAQAYVIRKYTLETLRRRSEVGGYILTGLRDTPISTSGIWDDLGQAKWTEDAFSQINGEAILCLDTDRRRTWQHGGDRPDPLDSYTFWSGSTAHWHIILHSGAETFSSGGYLRWELIDEDGRSLAWHKYPFKQDVLPGKPTEIGAITCNLPAVTRAVELRLLVKLKAGDQIVTNQWPVWVYPPVKGLPDSLAVVDPFGILDDFGEWVTRLPHRQPGEDLTGFARVITPQWDPSLCAYAEQGGMVILLQQGSGPLPVKRVPFWREAINLFSNHPLWEQFSHQGFTDMQFFGMASDMAFDTAQLNTALPAGAEILPILRRLDARAFSMTEYLFEARIGKGKLLACTLRLQGGQGSQPAGLRRNIAGQALLRAMLESQ